MRILILGLLLVPFLSSALADSGQDCRWDDGRPMSKIDCDDLMATKSGDAADREKGRRLTEDAHRLAAEREAARKADREAAQARAQEQAAIWRADHDRQEAESKAYREKMEREEARDQAAKKGKCGKDFMGIRVGMTLDRFELCHEAISFVTETTDKSGLIETYRSTFYFINARDGKIVSYTRRTQ